MAFNGGNFYDKIKKPAQAPAAQNTAKATQDLGSFLNNKQAEAQRIQPQAQQSAQQKQPLSTEEKMLKLREIAKRQNDKIVELNKRIEDLERLAGNFQAFLEQYEEFVNIVQMWEGKR